MDDNITIRTYDDVQYHARQRGQSVNDLITLAPSNDPYYAPGLPSGRRDAEWFLAVYRTLGFEKAWREEHRTVHLRRMHYVLVSQAEPLQRADAKEYRNTEASWDYLQGASKVARYAGLVDLAAIDDHRNPPVQRYGRHGLPAPKLQHVRNLPELWPWLSPLCKEPWLELQDYEAEQGVHKEVWVEKSTMDDILKPLCQELEAELQVGVGEMSITSANKLVQCLRGIGKPLRIVYISDFDPGGMSMPLAVARKVEWLVDWLSLVCDIKFYHVALTEQQVKETYKLPRIPIKETESRRGRFEEAYGEGATELDALEALYPGELARLVREALERCYDGTLDERTKERRKEVEEELQRIRASVVERYAWQLRRIREERDAIERAIAPRLNALRLQAAVVWVAMEREMLEQAPKLDDERYKLPASAMPVDEPAALYDSARDYMEQLAYYKAHQRRDVARPWPVAEFVGACCVLEEGAAVRTAVLSAAYRQRCVEQGLKPANPQAITAQLEELGLKRGRTKRGDMWRGICLRGDEMPTVALLQDHERSEQQVGSR